MTIVIEEKKKVDFQYVNVRFSIRFDFVLFPFNIVELVEYLVKAGYTPAIPPPPKPFGQIRLTVKGKIAQKGNVEVEVNDDRGVLAATSAVPALAVQSLNEILQIIRDKFGVDLDAKASFYETTGTLDARTNKNALEMMERFNEKNSAIKELGSLMGQDVSGYTLRLVPKGQVPSSAEWLDITIEPNIVKPSASYIVLTVFRSKEKSKVEGFVQSWTENMSRIFEAIEA